MTAEATAEPVSPASAEKSELPWLRLDIKLFYVNAAKFTISFAISITSYFLYDSGPVWPLLVVSGISALMTLRDLWRWLFTRYRVTPERVERRTGLLVREERHVGRDRIRSVSSSAKLRHRLVKLRVVHIGSGEGKHFSPAFKLDALSKETAAQLRRDLIPRDAEAPAEREVVIARLRWIWLWYNVFHVWAILAGVLFLVSLYFTMQTFAVDLIDVIAGLIHWANLGVWRTIGASVVITFVLGYFSLGLDFAAKHWNFELVRTTSGEDGTELRTRQGLFTTKTVHREDRRIRGVHLHEPLLWRWMRLAETKVITTGLNASLNESANILPRTPLPDARHAASFVFPDGHQPLEAPLLRHPVGAFRRRLYWATYGPAAVAGLLAWLGATGVVPASWWPLPLLLLPLTWALAWVAYRTLGHALIGPYLVVRSGAAGRSTTVLRTRAVIGWRLRQTIFQRLGSRMTIGVPTAAGDRYYRAIDAGTEQALAFVAGADPDLAHEFLSGTGTPPADSHFAPRSDAP
ncbi:PH domain-containing protein [Amycolatopsis sp. WQ 127309]|uniref:PH domain-containing protein n=1 Tax=Amycolatopsis sp. WQ 127309 TaxID=2932773 RepID=UPI001FF32035|nr:PH domain-containing protein [Amycolatopsis sp. WQ 127309]UOZ07135.1 PH domain-containing protein [Amycolatopsis sp. WQ 127309]